MEKGQMKNIVVLKNLPSNLVDEAIVILKPNKTAKKLEYIDKKDNIKKETKTSREKDYIIREVESVVSNYINSIDEKEKDNKKILVNKRYKTLKIYSIVITIGLVIFMLIWQ